MNSATHYTQISLINPRLRACAARVIAVALVDCLSVCVCVCVCVRACVRVSVRPSVRPLFFSVTAATLSVKRGHVIK